MHWNGCSYSGTTKLTKSCVKQKCECLTNYCYCTTVTRRGAAVLVRGRDRAKGWGWHVVTLVLWKQGTNKRAKLAQNKHVVCRWHQPPPVTEQCPLHLCHDILLGCCHMMPVIYKKGISFLSSCGIRFLIGQSFSHSVIQSVSQKRNKSWNTVRARMSLHRWQDKLAYWIVEVKFDPFLVSAIDLCDNVGGYSIDPYHEERSQG
jgi:hypothetical protein